MIVYSAHNELDEHVTVRVEDIASEPDVRIVLFAMGAAGLRNAGRVITDGRVVTYYDSNGRTIAAGHDTSRAMGAVVVCSLEATS